VVAVLMLASGASCRRPLRATAVAGPVSQRSLLGKHGSSSPSPCPPDAWDCGATSIFDREKCGRLGQKCCDTQTTGGHVAPVCLAVCSAPPLPN
jgi:hypothetical protein